MKNSLVKALAGIGFIAMVVFATMAFTEKTEDAQFVYCELLGTNKFMSKKVTVVVDYGQQMKFSKDHRIMDESTGKAKAFNSMVDAMNYMGQEGWEFAQAYVVTTGNTNVYHWLLKKKVQ